MSCPKHDPRGERPRNSFSVDGQTFIDVCLDCANEHLKGYKYMPEATIEELQQTIADYNTRIGRVTRAKASLKRLTDEYETARENKKQAENELDLSVADLDNHRQVSLPLVAATPTKDAAVPEGNWCPCGGREDKRGKIRRCTRIADVKYHADGCTIGAAVGSVDGKPKKKSSKSRAKTKAADAPVTTDGYAVGQRVAHSKRPGEFEVTEVIDTRHLRVKPLDGKSQTPVKVNVANLLPVADATAVAASA